MSQLADAERYPGDTDDLKKQVARIGIKGTWTQKSSNLLIWESDMTNDKQQSPTNPPQHATLTLDKETSRIEFQGDPIFREKFYRASSAYDDPMANLDKVDIPDRIIENLYLGAHESALNREALRERKITHIITAARGLRMAFQSEIKYKYIDLLDWEQEDIYKHFESCMEFIEEGRSQGGVLIHCLAGVSRSATITIAYLMYITNCDYADARKHVSSKRWIFPNNGFVRHLLKWENALNEKRKLLKKALKKSAEGEISKMISSTLDIAPSEEISVKETLSNEN